MGKTAIKAFNGNAEITLRKYSRPIEFLYFYRPINIILSADWSDYIKDKTRQFPKSDSKLYNRPIVGRRSADTSADDKW